MRLAAFIVLGASAAAAGPNAAVFGIATKDSGTFQESGGFGAEARFGWAFFDELALETSAGFTYSRPRAWLLYVSVGPKLAFFRDKRYSPYVRANAGLGTRTAATGVFCIDGVGSTCGRALDADWAFTGAAGAGLDLRLVREFWMSAELGWRRYFFDTGQSPRDLRGLWLGFSFG